MPISSGTVRHDGRAVAEAALAHRPQPVLELGVPEQLGQLDPGVDLCSVGSSGRSAVTLRIRSANAADSGVSGTPEKIAVEELLHDPLPLLGGRLRQPGHALQFGRGRLAVGQGPQRRPPQPQDPDLRPERVGVRGGHRAEVRPLVQHLPDGGDVEAEFPQRSHIFEAYERAVVVPAVVGPGPIRLRHQADVGVVPDRLDRKSAEPGQLADVHMRMVNPPESGGYRVVTLQMRETRTLDPSHVTAG